MKLSTCLFLLLFIACINTAESTILNVPSEHPTIQAGIDAAADGDTVIVAPGTYFENISFKGKSIVVGSNYMLSNNALDISNTIIDGGSPTNPDSGSVVVFVNAETPSSELTGFTLRNGSGTDNGSGERSGGAIYCFGSSPTINTNYIQEINLGEFSNISSSAGVGVFGISSPLIERNVFRDLSATTVGVAIHVNSGQPASSRTAFTTIERNVFTNIRDTILFVWSGVIGLHEATLIIRNNTFVNNQTHGVSLSISNVRIQKLSLSNNVFFADDLLSANTNAVWIGNPSKAIIEDLSYNSFYGTFVSYFNLIPTPGILDTSTSNSNGDVADLFQNIYLDPNLQNPSNHDFALRFDSPCIDAGNPDSQFNDPDGSINDIGAFPFASCCSLPGDANNDGRVNVKDISFIIRATIGRGAAVDCNDQADANGDNSINVIDARYLIAFVFRGGAEPICGSTGI